MPPPDALLDEIANSGVIVSATLGRHPDAWAGLPAHLREMVDQWGVRLGELHRRGARLAVGTDAGIAPLKPHGVLPYAVGELVDELGLSPAWLDRRHRAGSRSLWACRPQGLHWRRHGR